MPSSFDIISLNLEIFSWSVSAILCTLLIVTVFSLCAECTAFLESLLLFTVRQFFRSKTVYLSVVKTRESFHKFLLGILPNAFDVRFKISVRINASPCPVLKGRQAGSSFGMSLKRFDRVFCMFYFFFG